jgi:transcription elongation factor
VGEHVQRIDEFGNVVSTGIVVSVDSTDGVGSNSNIVAFNTLTGEQWQSNSKNVQSVREDSTGSFLNKSEFIVGDLVRIVDEDKNSTTGVVIKVDDGQTEQALVVIDVFGVNKRIPLTNAKLISHLSQIKHNVDDKITSGDAVQVIEQQTQRQSNLLVMHVQAESVFCKDPVTGQVTVHPLSSLKRKEEDKHYKGHYQRNVGYGLHPKGLLGKTVSISAGPYKGYLGIVKELTDTMARVELQSTSKLISVDRGRLVTNFGGFDKSGGYDRTVRTPAYAMASKTPSYISAGKTPAWNAGGKTPAWNVSGANKTPAWSMPSSNKTPAWSIPGMKTPTWSSTSQTDTGKTPAWSGVSGTDGTNLAPPKPDKSIPTISRDPRRQQQAVPLWIQPGVEVTSGDKKFTVTNVSANTISAVDITTKISITYSGTSEWHRVIPVKKDRVLIYGDGQHQKGSLIGLDGNDAVVKLDGTNDFRIINIDDLAKLS